jgi:hypothetical protein
MIAAPAVPGRLLLRERASLHPVRESQVECQEPQAT